MTTRQTCQARNDRTGHECTRIYGHPGKWHKDRTGTGWMDPLPTTEDTAILDKRCDTTDVQVEVTL